MALRTSQGQKRAAALVALAAVAAMGIVTSASRAEADSHQRREHEDGPSRYSVALWGDMPYNALGKQQYPDLLLDVNESHVAFSIFDGDLKAGGDGPCTDENLYGPAADYFGMLKRPLIFLVGDNDWTDCWGRYGASTTAPGADDPIERLNHERELFFSTPYSLGQTKLKLTRQSSEGGAVSIYEENVRWKYGPVVFIGMNIQGSNDNYPYAGVDGETRDQTEIDRQRAESLARRAACIAWLKEGFAYAKRERALGVMVAFQADLNFNNEQKLEDTRSWDAFPPYVDALRDEALAFSGQVALIHGDSHYFKLDIPLSGPAGGVVPMNFLSARRIGWMPCLRHWSSTWSD